MDTANALSIVDEPTPREREILEGLACGQSIAEIARRLAVPHHVASAEMWGLLRRIQARSRLHAVLLAAERGWIDVPRGRVPS